MLTARDVASDVESLPVEHTLPSATDNRSFTAIFSGTSIRALPLIGGLYEVAVLSERHGTDVLQLDLNGAAAAPPLKLVAACPSTGRTASLATGAGCGQLTSRMHGVEHGQLHLHLWRVIHFCVDSL